VSLYPHTCSTSLPQQRQKRGVVNAAQLGRHIWMVQWWARSAARAPPARPLQYKVHSGLSSVSAYRHPGGTDHQKNRCKSTASIKREGKLQFPAPASGAVTNHGGANPAFHPSAGGLASGQHHQQLEPAQIPAERNSCHLGTNRKAPGKDTLPSLCGSPSNI